MQNDDDESRFRLLKLHAIDAEDLKTVAATTHASVLKRGDIAFDRGRRRFALMMKRFRWENDDLVDGIGGVRIHCGLQINDVTGVQAIGLDRVTSEGTLELLNIDGEITDSPAAQITMTFAGGYAIRLQTGCVDVLVDDMGRPWYTPNRPDHGTDQD